MTKPANLALQKRGITLRPIDLSAPQSTLVSTLTDITILISAIAPLDQAAQIPLATAAKTAGVQRFLPCAYMPVVPAGGIHILRDDKEVVYNHIKTLHLPFTIVDVGWWYQITIPKIPSGKTDYMSAFNPNNEIAGTGDVPCALTDLGNIGRYIAKIIVDERTLNKYVLVYNEIWTQNQIYDLYTRITNSSLERKHVDEASLQARIDKAPEGRGPFELHEKVPAQYMISWGIRGDNRPEYAAYLGYVTSKELYPDFEFKTYEEYTKEVLDGKAVGIYAEMIKQYQEMMKSQAAAA